MTEQARVEAVIDAPAEAVWDFFRWDNLEAAVVSGLFAGVEYEERRPIPGAVRSVALTGGGEVRERLEAVAADGFGFEYSVLNLADFPLDHYRGRVSAEPLEGDRTRLTFACEFRPRGIAAGEWRETYAAMQQQFIAFVRARVEPQQPET